MQSTPVHNYRRYLLRPLVVQKPVPIIFSLFFQMLRHSFAYFTLVYFCVVSAMSFNSMVVASITTLMDATLAVNFFVRRGEHL